MFPTALPTRSRPPSLGPQTRGVCVGRTSPSRCRSAAEDVARRLRAEGAAVSRAEARLDIVRAEAGSLQPSVRGVSIRPFHAPMRDRCLAHRAVIVRREKRRSALGLPLTRGALGDCRGMRSTGDSPVMARGAMTSWRPPRARSLRAFFPKRVRLTTRLAARDSGRARTRRGKPLAERTWRIDLSIHGPTRDRCLAQRAVIVRREKRRSAPGRPLSRGALGHLHAMRLTGDSPVATLLLHRRDSL